MSVNYFYDELEKIASAATMSGAQIAKMIGFPYLASMAGTVGMGQAAPKSVQEKMRKGQSVPMGYQSDQMLAAVGGAVTGAGGYAGAQKADKAISEYLEKAKGDLEPLERGIGRSQQEIKSIEKRLKGRTFTSKKGKKTTTVMPKGDKLKKLQDSLARENKILKDVQSQSSRIKRKTVPLSLIQKFGKSPAGLGAGILASGIIPFEVAQRIGEKKYQKFYKHHRDPRYKG